MSVHGLIAISAKIGYGDISGKITILNLADGQLTVDKELPFLAGPVREIVWKVDGKAIVALGEKAVSFNPDSGSTTGDILGATGKILCAALTKEKVLLTAGEFNEILRHDVITFKVQGKKSRASPQGLCEPTQIEPGRIKFATGSADKSACVFDAKTGAVIKHYPACHKVGVILYTLD